MRRPGAALAALVAIGILVVPLSGASARKRSHKPSGIDGTVVNSTCAGPCVYPPPPSPPYTGAGLTVTVRRVADGALVATRTPTDGHFRFRLKHGSYSVTAGVAQPVPQPTPSGPTTQAVMPPACWQGDTQRVQVRRHRFTHVELQVSNVCILQPVQE